MKNMNPQNKEKTSYILLRLVYRIFELDKKIRRYGTDKPLFESEIHMIQAIRENEGIHVTGLAEYLNVTKGAVSQVIMKLEKKGMIVKGRDPENQSRLVLTLTPKGETAYRNHEKLHQEFDELVEAILKGTSEEHRSFLKRFMRTLDQRLDAFVEKNGE